MIKFFSRLYLLMILLCGFLLIYSVNVTINNSYAREFIGNSLGKGNFSAMFSYLNQKLLPEPEATWPHIVAHLNPQFPHYPLQIVPLNSIKLSSARQRQRLNAGKMVTDLYFSPIEDSLALSSNNQTGPIVYQRLGNSNQALAYVMIANQDVNMLAQQAWLLSFIMTDLKQHSKIASSQVLQQFSRQYGIQVKKVPITQLDSASQIFLSHNQYFYKTLPALVGSLTYLYYTLSGNEVLIIGPYPYSWFINHYYTFWLMIYLLMIGAIMFASVYPFYRDFNKLKALAENYGQGKFTYEVKIKRYAALYRFYQNLKNMGAQIAKLIASHKELTEALSHELKTPLARLKFAVKMAEEEKNNSALYFAEADHAINTLDKLISELLLYFSFDRRQLDFKLNPVSMSAWLNPIIAEKQQEFHFGKLLTLEITKAGQKVQANLAPIYFKKAIDNLLSNAFRHAHHEIKVTLDADKAHCYLHIADDGAGIPTPHHDKFFQPFFSLDESSNKELSGHGLGLAIVARIVTAHQGRIKVITSQMGGAEFVVILPLYSPS